MRWCSSIEYAVSTFHKEFISNPIPKRCSILQIQGEGLSKNIQQIEKKILNMLPFFHTKKLKGLLMQHKRCEMQKELQKAAKKSY